MRSDEGLLGKPRRVFKDNATHSRTLETKDILVFYSQSADKAPGRGAHESVDVPTAYEGLAAIPHWRRVLSNFYEHPFTFQEKTYATVEHAFQAQKFAPHDAVLAF